MSEEQLHRDRNDDALTLSAMGALAFMLADVSHEALGHGVATLACGGTPVLLTSSYFSSAGHYSRWIPAAGGIANVVVGLMALACLRAVRKAASPLRYFLFLLAAFNLLFAAGYPAYIGVALFGDWAAVIAGLSPVWLWRALLVASSILFYWLFLYWLAATIWPFCGAPDKAGLERLRRITLIPFLSALAIACIAGSLNPQGPFNILTAAAPAAAGSFGMTQLDHFQSVSKGSSPVAARMGRSYGWIAAAAIAGILFVAVLGPGIRFR